MNEGRTLPQSLVALMKLRVVVLLQITAVCAIVTHDLLLRHGALGDLPSRSWLDTGRAVVLTVVAGTLSAGGSNAINMWYDADIDPHMARTARRPVPAGDVSATTALLFGLVIATLGSGLFLFAHWKAAMWSAFSVLFYVLVYTIALKRRTPQNIVIGGIAGSTPPLIGWAVAASTTGALDVGGVLSLGSAVPWMLFLLIFLWTPPHFWALALYRSGEYGKVGVPMMPDVHGPQRTVFESKVYCVLLLLLGVVPVMWPSSGLSMAWVMVSTALSLRYARTVWKIDLDEPLDEEGRMPTARASFFASLRYLAWMFMAMVVFAAVPPSWLGPLGPL